VQTLEQRVTQLERQLLETNGRMLTAARALQTETRENHALGRLLMSVTALAARDAADPLKFMDEVRNLALAPLVDNELADTRERIEMFLSKVEGALTKR